MTFWLIDSPRYAVIAAETQEIAMQVYEQTTGFSIDAQSVIRSSPDRALNDLIGRMTNSATIEEQIAEVVQALKTAHSGDVIALQ